jgi:hypothetical protein
MLQSTDKLAVTQPLAPQAPVAIEVTFFRINCVLPLPTSRQSLGLISSFTVAFGLPNDKLRSSPFR